jgi:hypothetical protein
MPEYEYKVVAAPRRAKRIKTVKAGEDRFAATLAEAINEAAQGGWEYVRAETLPCEERPGILRSKVETLHSVLVFRRPKPAQPAAVASVPPLRAVAPEAESADVPRIVIPLPQKDPVPPA